MITNFMLLAMVAQVSTIHGQLRDAQSHETIVSARVELLFEGTPVDLQYSDRDGRFGFVNVMPRRYKVSAAYAGYEKAIADLDSGDSTWVLIEMNRSVKPASIDAGSVVSLKDYAVPDRARKEFDRGQKEMRRQDCAKAIQHLENGLRLFNRSAAALNDLGNCYRKVGALEKAEDAFNQAMTLSGSSHIALNLAEVYTSQKRFREAEHVLQNALRKTPQDGNVYFGLAAAYFAEGRLPDAETAAIQADARPHSIADLHLLMAKIYLRKNPEAVLGQLEIYLKEAPNGAQSKQIRQMLKDRPAPRRLGR